MKIRSVEFLGAVAHPGDPPPDTLPQIAVSGRSNVGKSSLINAVLRRTRRRVAHVSSRPGKTRAIHFYRVNSRFLLVDLPGYGYARVPQALRARWRPLVESYLSSTPGLRGVIHLVDSRRPPTPFDLQMVEYLAGLALPTLVVLTKIDRVPRSRRRERAREAAAVLGVDADQVLPFSARTGEGRDELLEAIEGLLVTEGGR